MWRKSLHLRQMWPYITIIGKLRRTICQIIFYNDREFSFLAMVVNTEMSWRDLFNHVVELMLLTSTCDEISHLHRKLPRQTTVGRWRVCVRVHANEEWIKLREKWRPSKFSMGKGFLQSCLILFSSEDKEVCAKIHSTLLLPWNDFAPHKTCAFLPLGKYLFQLSLGETWQDNYFLLFTFTKL